MRRIQTSPTPNPRSPATISPTSSSRDPIAVPIPAVFSTKIRIPLAGNLFAACLIDSTAIDTACVTRDSPRAPGCTTTKSAPSANARTNSS